jgi:hypothetical protein
MNISLTQAGNYTAIVAFLVLVANHFGFNITEGDATTIVLGVVTIGAQIISVYGRYRQGDVSLLGVKAPNGEIGL